MFLAKVIGTLVSTKKDDRLIGSKLLIIRRINEHEEEEKETLVAVDTVGAGNGEIVLVITGSGARLLEDNKDTPIDTAIVGIVDYLEVSK